MNINGKPARTIWVGDNGWSVGIIDQTLLPHRYDKLNLTTVEQMAEAISTMRVRGAPLIGVAAAYGVCLAMRADPSDASLALSIELLARQRPTAVNLRWALEEMRAVLFPLPPSERQAVAYARAREITDDDVENCRRIGVHGLQIVKAIAATKKSGEPINILTHCNAGWLACVDWGSATSTIYQAHEASLPVHVWVDETRPRNQGAALTAFELGGHGVPYTLIADNAGGHLMQHGKVDLCIVGADRVTASGDVANKVGTYLKALAAKDTGVQFYAAFPSSTIDWSLNDGRLIPIEDRSPAEVLTMSGKGADGRVVTIDLAPPGAIAVNPAFDVTPARLMTGLITERGVCPASREGLLSLYPERKMRG